MMKSASIPPSGIADMPFSGTSALPPSESGLCRHPCPLWPQIWQARQFLCMLQKVSNSHRQRYMSTLVRNRSMKTRILISFALKRNCSFQLAKKITKDYVYFSPSYLMQRRTPLACVREWRRTNKLACLLTWLQSNLSGKNNTWVCYGTYCLKHFLVLLSRFSAKAI